MVLLAKRVRANRPPVNNTSTSSAEESLRIRSKISPACWSVSIPYQLFHRSRSLKRAAYFDPSESSGRRAVSRSHHLLRLAFPAVRSSPQSPLVARADSVHRIPELGRDTRIRGVLQHPHAFTVLDLPPNLASTLKVISLVVNGPRAVGLHQDRVIGRRDELLRGQRLLPRQDADVRHSNHRQPVPSFGAQGPAGTIQPDRMRRLSRTQISSKQSSR